MSAQQSMEERAKAAGLEILHWDPELDKAFEADPFGKWDEAYAKGPLFYSTAGRGFFVASGYDTCKQVLQDAATFSSVENVAYTRDPIILHMIPLTYDPPEQTAYRRVLNPLFSPGVVATREARLRSIIRGLVDEIAEKPQVEVVSEFASKVPAVFFLEWLGLDPEKADRFCYLAWAQMFEGFKDVELLRRLEAEVYEIIDELFEAKRRAPGPDLASELLEARMEDGRPLTNEELREITHLLFNAGLETTAMALSFMFLHLAQNPDDRRRMVGNTAVIQTAVEEFLRVYGTLGIVGRTVLKDTEVKGCPMHAGDRVFVATPSANRHIPNESPVQVKIDRWPNRHAIFGLGPHRCIGSHVARAELQIALEEFHARIPDYRLVEGAEITYHSTFQQRPIAVPLQLGVSQ